MTSQEKKLHDCLIMIGKEAEKANIPTPDDLHRQFDRFMAAIIKQDMRAMTIASRELAGSVAKFMVERL